MAPAWHVWVLSASGVVGTAVRRATFAGERALSADVLPVWLVLPALLLFCGAIVGGVVWQARHRAPAARAHDARLERGRDRSSPARQAMSRTNEAGPWDVGA